MGRPLDDIRYRLTRDAWVAALIDAYLRLYGNPTVGRRRLYDAVNDAWCDIAYKRILPRQVHVPHDPDVAIKPFVDVSYDNYRREF
jgi:hypothetical protein